MILFGCLIVFIISILGSCLVKDIEEMREEDYRIEKKRHKELMQKRSGSRRKVTTRRIIKQDDVTLGEEIIEEFFE